MAHREETRAEHRGRCLGGAGSLRRKGASWLERGGAGGGGAGPGSPPRSSAPWEAREACEEKGRAGWNEEWREAYGHPKSRRFAALDPEVKAALERLHKDDEDAEQAHQAAEAQFDEADRRMSGSMACTGAQMAIDAWEMREKFIQIGRAHG